MPIAVPDRARLRAAPAALAVLALLLLVAVVPAGPARAAGAEIAWAPCGIAGAECGTLEVPLVHSEPDGPRLAVAVSRRPASDPERRVGSLVINFGGPGAPGAEILRDLPPELATLVFPVVSERFDLVAVDPRGTGGTLPVDCRITADDGFSEEPVTPQTLDVAALLADAARYAELCAARNPGVLGHVSTADSARDLDLLRAALGEDRLTFLGFSYGTFVGATYASLFPERQGRMVLDGALDAQGFVDRPLDDLRAQASGFERALSRFLAACAADQAACAGFGGADPRIAFDELVEGADATPIPAASGDPVTGLEILEATQSALYAREAWPLLAVALAQAEAGDASIFREVLGLDPVDPEIGASVDRYIATTALDAAWPREPHPYLDGARQAWSQIDHFWLVAGYENVAYALWPGGGEPAFRGPFRSAPDAPAALVLGTTYDPATPYRWSVALAEQLGNARLLTQRGDGHGAFGARSSCIDAAVVAYLLDGALPEPGTVCPQELPFAQPEIPTDQVAEDQVLETLEARLTVAGS